MNDYKCNKCRHAMNNCICGFPSTSISFETIDDQPILNKILYSKEAMPPNEGLKYDDGKLRYDLIPPIAMEELAKILTYGSRKYADNTWQNVKPFKPRYYGALMRHIQEWRKGNLVDEESGELHLSHAFCCLMFLLHGGNKDK